MTATGNESHIDNSVEVAARAAVPGHPLLMSGDGVQCHGASIHTHWHWPIWVGGHQDQGDTVVQCGPCNMEILLRMSFKYNKIMTNVCFAARE